MKVRKSIVEFPPESGWFIWTIWKRINKGLVKWERVASGETQSREEAVWECEMWWKKMTEENAQ